MVKLPLARFMGLVDLLARRFKVQTRKGACCAVVVVLLEREELVTTTC